MKKLCCCICLVFALTACSSEQPAPSSRQPASAPPQAADPAERTVTEAAQEMAQDVTDKAKELAEEATDAAQEMAEEAKNAVAQVGAQVKDAALEAKAEAEKAVEQAGDKVAAVAASFEKGKSVYEASCKLCHDSGLMGAPKLGDERYSADLDTLVSNSIAGIGQMPPRGGNQFLSDDDVRAAVEYMVEQSK